MPEMDGLSALKQIKQNPELNNIPVIMLTGYSQGGLVKQSMQAGVAGYIVKPGDRATLINRIEEALSPGDGN